MNIATLVFILLGLIGFGLGAHLAATGERVPGIVLMGSGLVFQVLALRRIRAAKSQNPPGEM